MSIYDLLTGGQSTAANNALDQAQQDFKNIPVPTAAQLTLPELQQYVEAGILTPAQAQTALQQSNAFNTISTDPATREAETTALNQIEQVAGDAGMTPEMKAQLTAALDTAGTQENGANASILDQMAQKGIPTSLMGTAAEEANAANQAQTANLAGTTAAGQAEANAISAMMNEGNLASTMHGQDYSEAANKAAAQNAMQQWNAGATNTTNEANAARAQTANEYNATNKQNVSNENTGLANKRTEYNATVPETVFNNQITKAGGEAGVSENQAAQDTQQGNAILGLVGAGAGAAGTALAPAPVVAAKGTIVPGKAPVPGDSPKNDVVHAMLSPGEVVVPRTIAPHPEAVKRFVSHLMKKPVAPAHPDDVHSVLEALSRRRSA